MGTRRAYIGLPEAMDDPNYLATITAMWDAAVELVDGHAPDAPEAVSNAAALNVFAYLWADRGGHASMKHVTQPGADPLRKSGALSMLADYREAVAVTPSEA